MALVGLNAAHVNGKCIGHLSRDSGTREGSSWLSKDPTGLTARLGVTQ